MSAVSCSKQFPHMRHPNSGPFTLYSSTRKACSPNVSFWNGEKAGCQRRPGVKPVIRSPEDYTLYIILDVPKFYPRLSKIWKGQKSVCRKDDIPASLRYSDVTLHPSPKPASVF